jgi:hypothetical protein
MVSASLGGKGSPPAHEDALEALGRGLAPLADWPTAAPYNFSATESEFSLGVHTRSFQPLDEIATIIVQK